MSDYSNVLSSISEYANDSFKENSCEEREAFIETLIESLKTMNLWRWWKNHKTFPYIPDEPMQQTTKLFNLETFVVYGIVQNMVNGI